MPTTKYRGQIGIVQPLSANLCTGSGVLLGTGDSHRSAIESLAHSVAHRGFVANSCARVLPAQD